MGGVRGAVITVGHPGDLADVAGVADTPDTCDEPGRPVRHVQFHDAPIWTQRPDIALHAIGGYRLVAGDDVDVPASWEDGTAAVTLRRTGRGMAICCGADLWQSIVRIQQGFPVAADGAPAGDGTAPIDDDILKCEDGLALDFERDRAMPPGEPALPADFQHGWPPESAVPLFHKPQADMWRSIFLQCLWFATEHAGIPSGWLHYWPSGVPAIAHLSHDADLNDDDHAQAALDTFAEAGVSVTWCQLYPGGYSPDIYAAVSAAGHEQALHYNAMADADIAHWGWPQLREQYAWAQTVTGVETIVTNKNHYTRWEGWVEFYLWCEQLGIEIDQSRGPSKLGTTGFPFGTAHVSFPIADAEHGNRFLDVLALPLHTQDLEVAAHPSARDVILDGAFEQHGVAHFLFHGAHLHGHPPTRAACLELITEARRRGMQWWTSQQINRWERLRRGVRVSVRAGRDGWTVRATAEDSLPGAAILLQLPGRSPGSPPPGLRESDHGGRVATVTRHGREFVELTVDIPADGATWSLVRGDSHRSTDLMGC